jgi:LPPG:FO 2-phospho-L-lactate transferase
MTGRVVVLTGGVGGAKLVLGLAHTMPPESITAIVNTGDDFQHLGLSISPDIDTLLYTLAGKSNTAQGWGTEGESWSFMAALKSLGGADWFQLGDGDLALHVLRTQALAAGEPLSAVIARFARAWGIGVSILPMTDQRVETHLATAEGDLAFQEYFVARRCVPVIKKITFEGASIARPGPSLLDAILSPTTSAILIAPSNPYLSIDPILAVPGIAEALTNASAPIVAVSPLVGGNSVKGPTAKLMREMQLDVTPATIAAHYTGIIDGLLIDSQDAPCDLGVAYASADILMQSLTDRRRVAQVALDFAASLARTRPG